MIAATVISGQPVPVPNTPIAASSTAQITEHIVSGEIHAERMLMPAKWHGIPRYTITRGDVRYWHSADMR